MTWKQLFSPCAFGHEEYPVMVRVNGETKWECRSCMADLGPILRQQKRLLRATPSLSPAVEALTHAATTEVK
jgi:hypothetical protein